MNDPAADITLRPRRPWQAVVEVALIFLLLLVFAGSPPPSDDEVHYLGKAKQYWNPDWLAGDFFLETPDAHVVFNWTVGWLTLYFSLPVVAWIGRIAAWLLLAFAWRRLSWALHPRAWVSLLTMALFLWCQEYFTVAREWIVGGVEAKCFAYGFVLLALEQLVRRRWNWVWPLLGIASAFHVLVGGWSVVAALLAWGMTKDRPRFTVMLPSLIMGGLFSLPALIPSLMLTWNADPAVVAEANQIYVFDRLNHHLLFYDFSTFNKLAFLVLLCGWVALCYATRDELARLPMRRFILSCLIIAFVGIVVDQATMHRPELAASLLRYYWYRLADVMVPIGLSFAMVLRIVGRRTWPFSRQIQWTLAILVIVPTFILSRDFTRQFRDGRPTADQQSQLGEYDASEYDDWLQTCAWIQDNTRPSDRFMIPPHIQTFRWYAQRSEVVSHKDIPQNAEGIVEWSRRVHRVRRWYADVAGQGLSDDALVRLRAMASPDDYDFQYIIVGRPYGRRRLPLPEVYASSEKNLAFVVYRVPPM